MGGKGRRWIPGRRRNDGGRAAAQAYFVGRFSAGDNHGAIASLLVPMPTPAIVGALRAILTAHNLIEEGPAGVYDRCERLLGDSAAALLARLRHAPEVPLNPHLDTTVVAGAVRRALRRVGYDPQALGL